MRTITTVNRTVSLSAYLRAIKTAIAKPHAEFNEGLTCWWPCTGAEIRGQFRESIDERINQAVPYIERGRSA